MKDPHILPIVAMVAGYVFAGVGIIGQAHGMIHLGVAVACVAMAAAVLYLLVKVEK